MSQILWPQTIPKMFAPHPPQTDGPTPGKNDSSLIANIFRVVTVIKLIQAPLSPFKKYSILSTEHLFSMSFDFLNIFYEKKIEKIEFFDHLQAPSWPYLLSPGP